MTDQLNHIRNTYAIIIQAAVKECFPDTTFGEIQVSKNGFMVDVGTNLNNDDLKKITEKAKELLRSESTITTQVISLEDAQALLNDEVQQELAQTYSIDNQVRICSFNGHHFVLKSEDEVINNPRSLRTDAFELDNLSSAYLLGDNTRPVLQRISAYAFETKKELSKFFQTLEEAKKRDHRVIGKALNLFHLDPSVGSGLPIFLPNGALMRLEIENFEREEHLKRGYVPVYTPHIYDAGVWKRSGHYDFYKDNMFLFENDGREYGVKPMNCPGHVSAFSATPKTYRDMPQKYFELGTVYRNEISGTLHGLMRVTSITQDDAHIFCQMTQLADQITETLHFVKDTLKVFGFDMEYKLSTRPEKSLGSDEVWEKATAALKEALARDGIDYTIDEGGGAFYGPKIDVQIKDALGRGWQGPTIQVDFNLPERFDLSYINQEGKAERPVMVHRTILGAIERFMGVMIENFNGYFPLWLAPEQVAIMTVGDNPQQQAYAQQIEKDLKSIGVRSFISTHQTNLNGKIKDAQKRRIPYMVILGDKEVENRTVSIRCAKGGKQVQGILLSRFMSTIRKEILTRSKDSLLIDTTPHNNTQTLQQTPGNETVSTSSDCVNNTQISFPNVSPQIVTKTNGLCHNMFFIEYSRNHTNS